MQNWKFTKAVDNSRIEQTFETLTTGVRDREIVARRAANQEINRAQLLQLKKRSEQNIYLFIQNKFGHMSTS